MSYTRQRWRNGALREADLVGLIDDADANEIVQEEVEALYDLLVGAFDDYNITISGNLTPSAGTDTVDLPADFYKLRGVDWLHNGEWRDLARFELGERNERGTRRYTIRGTKLVIAPASVAPSTTVRLLYVPQCPTFSDDVTAFGVDFMGFEKRVIHSAAARFLTMEKSDTTKQDRAVSEIDQRIETMRSKRDANRPKQATDRKRDLRYYLRRGIPFEEIP